ncbi:hypothetical protein F5Y10DRAFT_286608 [Nemania abortiva]|nr:hypothetical protein F5Y10DRAFT_286608 [Nemania abortiva]
MPSTSCSSAEAGNNAVAVGKFQFISIQAPDDAKDQFTRRLARSHAVKQALKNKRKLQQESRDNFRVTTSQDKLQMSARRRTRTRTVTTAMSFFSPSADKLDPFATLPVDSSRLQALLNNHAALQAPEPVFSVAEEAAFQSFRSVFRTGLVDPALLSAVMLTLAFSAAGGSINRECLGYRGQAISYVRERMSSPGEATSEATIGAILLLAGVEARLGMTSQVQLHMEGVRLLLGICQRENVQLNGGIKRAIFWQDLNSSILSGSSRIVDHKTFSELRWTRDSFPQSYFRLPPGFQMRSHLLSKNFIEVLEDLHALQCIRNATSSKLCEALTMAYINNHSAFVQSRLAALPNLSSVVACCRLAAYLCSTMLSCKIWCALVIPFHVSSRLLSELQKANDDPVWNDHPDLLLWLLYTGGAFAPAGVVQSNYVALLRSNSSRCGHLYASWPVLLETVKRFIWSEKAFRAHFRAFWEDNFIQQ